ncbi:MAG: type II toxin-antitoxin system VapC family toxin [Cyanobacteria bacterium P01_A01_bin.17]
MRLLLDTHAFLWFVLDSPQMSQDALQLIQNPVHDIYISPVSYWEIAIKVSLGKYEIPGSFQDWMEHQLRVNSFDSLPITVAHAAMVSTLPFHHRDPFDRLLCAQTLVEKIPIISTDDVFDLYGVERQW